MKPLLLPAAAALLALVLPTVAVTSVSPARVPVIVDADVGDDIDDAYALAWALKSLALDVRAIVTAYGDTALRTRMTRRMLAVLGRSGVAVGQGVPTAPGTTFTQRAWAEAGPTGPAPDGVALALDTIRRNPGRITLIALAPLTNIKAMIARDPATFRKLRRVVLMGGSVRRGYDKGGRPSPVPDAEYNVARDPAGLRLLLASGVPVTMMPLDSTQVRPDAATLSRIVARLPMLAELTREWRATNPWKQNVPTLFDAVTVGAAIDPASCPTVPIHIAVTADGHTVEGRGKPNVRVCLRSDGPAFVARMAADLAR